MPAPASAARSGFAVWAWPGAARQTPLTAAKTSSSFDLISSPSRSLHSTQRERSDEDSRTVRDDWFDTGRRDGSFLRSSYLRSRTGSADENDESADEKERDAGHGRDLF